MPEKPSVTLPGTVEKIMPSLSPEKPETARMSLETDQHLYREVRIENTLTNKTGGKVGLKLGSPAEVAITAEAGCTTVQSRIPFSQEPCANHRTESQPTRSEIARASFRAVSATTVGEFVCPFCGKTDLAVFMGKVDFSASIDSDDLLGEANVSLAALICGKSHLFFVLEADVARTLSSLAA